MKTIQKKYRNKNHKIRKTSSKRVLMDFETCDLSIFLRPQPSSFEGFKKGEVVVLDPKTKQLTKVK